jgi:hypothetical protein
MRKTMPAKRRGQQGVAVSREERQQMAIYKAAGLSHSEISRRTGRTREAIINALRSPDIVEMRQRARDVLTANLEELATHWLEAARVGAGRGRHEPVRDALLHLGAIEPLETHGTTGIQINVGLPLFGCPGWKPDQDDAKPVTLEVTPTTTSNDEER